MKKSFIIIFAILALVLCACAAEAPEPTPMPTPEVTPVRVEYPSAPGSAECAAMMDFMRGNRAIVVDGRLFSFDFDEEFKPVLISAVIADNALGEVALLAENCLPTYLAYREGCLYYINEADGNCVESLSLSGGERKILSEPDCSYLSIVDDRIYYCDAQGRFCSAAMDGGNVKILLDRACCYPYLLGDCLLYQSEDDAESLHYYSLKNGADEKLTAIASYAPVAIGDKIYFTGKTENGMRVCAVPLCGGETELYESDELTGAAEFYMAGDEARLRFIVGESGKLSQYDSAVDDFAPALISEGVYRRGEFAAEYRVDTAYWKDGRIRCFILTLPDGTEIEYIRAIMAGN